MGGRPGTTSIIPITTPAPAQPTDPPSPSEVQEIPPEEVTRKAPEVSSKRLTKDSTSQRKKAKVPARHKSCCEGEKSKSRADEGKEPTARLKGHRLPGQNQTTDLYTLPSEVLMDRAAKTIVLLSSRLKDSCDPDAVATVEQWASETRSQADNLQSELEEVTQRWESLEKELGETRGTLSNSREKLSEAQGQLANS
ncbi:hypothetical protein B296_00026487 [Ensete ventricosum]|uniref:Uncharacterized protein n=1 Tax=Ensete ventricosum TaxID=4639 RepID=A0A426XUI0_ENSVE|nr:hypothetical protein B296_00026487 [Ensete ventricosum]